MVTVNFFEKPGCANNRRQKEWLSASGHELVIHNLLGTAWTAESLRVFFGQRPVAEWFNRAAPKVKSGQIRPEQQTEDSALRLMLNEPLLIRRPLLQVGERREVGFDPALIDAWIGLVTDDDKPPQNIEQCQRKHACSDPTTD